MSIRDELRVPAFCPVCERMMCGTETIHRFYSFGCCTDCYIEWVEDREDRWNGGWRPTAEQVEQFCKKLKAPRD